MTIKLHAVQGVLRFINLPPGWVLQDSSPHRSLGGGEGSFVVAATDQKAAYMGYLLPARSGWVSLAVHLTIFLDDLISNPTPRVALDIWLEKPCEAQTLSINEKHLMLVSEINMRPGDACDCSRIKRQGCAS